MSNSSAADAGSMANTSEITCTCFTLLRRRRTPTCCECAGAAASASGRARRISWGDGEIAHGRGAWSRHAGGNITNQSALFSGLNFLMQVLKLGQCRLVLCACTRRVLPRSMCAPEALEARAACSARQIRIGADYACVAAAAGCKRRSSAVTSLLGGPQVYRSRQGAMPHQGLLA